MASDPEELSVEFISRVCGLCARARVVDEGSVVGERSRGRNGEERTGIAIHQG